MQAASLCFTPPLPLKKAAKGSVPRRPLRSPCRKAARLPPVAAVATPPDSLSVDYSSPTSVFPAEACETVGGDACDVEMFPEAKPAAQARGAGAGAVASEEVDREYVEYDEPKTVFRGEACDDLGGEFCEPEYQDDVSKG